MTLLIFSLKIFVPLAILAFVVLVPINWTGKTLEHATNVSFSDIDKLSISNIPAGSKRSKLVYCLSSIDLLFLFFFFTLYEKISFAFFFWLKKYIDRI